MPHILFAEFHSTRLADYQLFGLRVGYTGFIIDLFYFACKKPVDD